MWTRAWTWFVMAWIGSILPAYSAAGTPGATAVALPFTETGKPHAGMRSTAPVPAVPAGLTGPPPLATTAQAQPGDTELDEPSGTALMLSGLVLVALIVKRRRDNADGVGPDCIRPPRHH